jgi:hypothetical protein
MRTLLKTAPGTLAGALFFAGLFTLPWAAWGALGSPLDSFIQLAEGLAFGLLAALLIDRFLLGEDIQAAENRPGRRWQEVLFAGFTSGTLLVMLASGTTFPFAGMQLLLTICLPLLGWMLAVLAITGRDYAAPGETRHNLPALALLAGLCRRAYAVHRCDSWFGGQLSR